MATTPQYAGGDPVVIAQVELVKARPVRAIPVPVLSGLVALTARPVLLCGWSFRETTGAAGAASELVNGGDPAHTNFVGAIALASGGSQAIAFDEGVWCDMGLYIAVATGSMRGAVWVKF